MTDASAPEMEWDDLAPGGQISATVVMMSGFVLPDGQRVRERYQVQGVIGEGAMGQVLAVKLVGSADQQTYALKVVARPVDADDDGVIDEVEAAEARRTAQWFAELLRAEAAKQDQVQRHGVSVARMFALVQLDDGSIGMRMELARGESLDDWIDKRKAEPEKAPEVLWSLQVVRKLVSQLRRLHEMADTGSPFGFVHSDIKPGNVFVDDKDSSDIQITLLDFGVATAGHALANGMPSRAGGRKTFVLQQTGGTIGYAPPMHFSTKATPLSDVYASLVILYELITFQFPWNFGEMEIIPDNIVMLETAMIRGPRPVRDIRPNIHHEDARALDEFFSREFALLNEMAERVHKVFANDDDSSAQQKMIDKLSVLARDYQVKLDQLRARVAPSRRPNAADLLPVSPEDLVEKPTPLAIPKAPRTPRFNTPDTFSDESGDRSSPVPAHGKPARPVLMVMPSILPPPMSESKDEAEPRPSGATEPPWVSLWRNHRPLILAAMGVPIVAAITVLALKSSQHTPSQEPTHAAVVDTSPTPQPPTTPAPPTPQRDPTPLANSAPTQPPTPMPARAHHNNVTLAEVRTAPVVTFVAPVMANAQTAPAATTVAPGAQSCSCVSSIRGTRVVAHGGTLGHETVLCVTDRAAADGRAEFYGSGTIPADVFTALPQIECQSDGDAALDVTVQRYSTSTGAASLFRCRRGSAPGTAPAPPSAESPPAAPASVN